MPHSYSQIHDVRAEVSKQLILEPIADAIQTMQQQATKATIQHPNQLVHVMAYIDIAYNLSLVYNSHHALPMTTRWHESLVHELCEVWPKHITQFCNNTKLTGPTRPFECANCFANFTHNCEHNVVPWAKQNFKQTTKYSPCEILLKQFDSEIHIHPFYGLCSYNTRHKPVRNSVQQEPRPRKHKTWQMHATHSRTQTVHTHIRDRLKNSNFGKNKNK